MIHKQIYITLLSGLFVFGITKSAQHGDPSDYAKQQAIKRGMEVLGTQVNDMLNYAKQKNGILSPFEESQLRLNASQEDLNNTQNTLAKKHTEEADIDIHLKKIAVTKETCAALPKNDAEAKNQIERLKLKMLELNKTLPERKTDEAVTVKIDTKNDQKNTIKDKASLVTKLTAPFAIAATTTGQLADFLAAYSFAYITNLEYFKGTFIGNNAQAINRCAVFATITALAYITYKKYKSLNDEDEDLFDNDEE